MGFVQFSGFKLDSESRSLFDSRVRCVECHSAAMQGMLHAGPSPIHWEFIREQLQMKDPAPAAAPQPAPPMCIAHPPAEPRQTLGPPRRTRSMPPALRRSALLPLPPADPRRPTGRPLPPLPPADPRPLREKTVAEITARLDKVNQRMEEIRAAEADRIAAEADRIAAEADRIAGETDVTPDIADWRPEGHEDAPTGAEGAPEWECGNLDIHFQWLLGYAAQDGGTPVRSGEIPDAELPERTHPGAERSSAAIPPRARSRSPRIAAEQHLPEGLVPRIGLTAHTGRFSSPMRLHCGLVLRTRLHSPPGRREAHAARAARTGRGARAPLPSAEYATRVGSPASRPHTGADDCICWTCEFQRWVQGLEPGCWNRGPCTGAEDCVCLNHEFERWVQCDHE